MLGPVNVGQQARDAMTALAREFIAVEQTAQVREAYLTMERDGQRRVEDWLRVLANEHAVSAGDIALLRPQIGEDRYFVVTRWDTREHYQQWSDARPAGNHADDERRGMSVEVLGFEVVPLGE